MKRSAMHIVLVLAVLASAGAARAADFQVRFAPGSQAPLIRMPAVFTGAGSGDLFVPATDYEAGPTLPRGVAKTAVDHRFSPSGGVVGSLGYLCGIQKSPGAAGDLKSSYEPAGTFLGGQLKVAF